MHLATCCVRSLNLTKFVELLGVESTREAEGHVDGACLGGPAQQRRHLLPSRTLRHNPRPSTRLPSTRRTNVLGFLVTRWAVALPAQRTTEPWGGGDSGRRPTDASSSPPDAVSSSRPPDTTNGQKRNQRPAVPRPVGLFVSQEVQEEEDNGRISLRVAVRRARRPRRRRGVFSSGFSLWALVWGLTEA